RSGNSSRSTSSTCPMLSLLAPEELGLRAAEAGIRSGLPVEGVVGQSVLPDLHVLAGLEAGLVHTVLAHVGAVEGAEITHQEPIAVTHEGGVLAGDGHVVEED